METAVRALFAAMNVRDADGAAALARSGSRAYADNSIEFVGTCRAARTGVRKHYRSRQPEFAPSLSPIPATLRTGAQTGAHDTRRPPTWLEQAA